MTFVKFKLFISFLIFALVFSGCGGGSNDAHFENTDNSANNVNHAPTANAQSISLNADTPNSLTLSGSDPEGDLLTYIVVTQPTHGTLSGTGQNLTYTPNPNFDGEDSFTFKTNDGQTDSTNATVNITVNNVNHAPIITGTPVTTIDENEAYSFVPTITDPDEDPLTCSVANLPVWAIFNSTTGEISGTPGFNDAGIYSNIVISCTDGEFTTSLPPFDITVNNVNRPPVANPQSIVTGTNEAVSITLTGSDPDANPLAYIIDTFPSHGTLTQSESEWIYTPNHDYLGSDSFTFKVNNGTEDSTITTVSIAIKPIFISTWKTDNIINGSSDDHSINLPLYGGNFDVDWGDGSTIETGLSSPTLHTYSNIGTYTIKVYGSIGRIIVAREKDKILTVEKWGTNTWADMSSAFYEVSNLEINAVDNPNLSNVTDMSMMFWNAPAFNSDLSTWDVSNVTDMNGIFGYARAFNSDLSTWDVSNVTDMHRMFIVAFAFNQDLSTWDVSNVTNMSSMFENAAAFNQDLSTWDVFNVTNMSSMFNHAFAFNQDLSTWDVTNVTNMYRMFYEARAFNSDLSTWNVSNVTNMSSMFYEARAFNSDLSTWDVTNVTNMYRMFYEARAFNSDLSTWNVSNVTSMIGLFYHATAFNSDLSTWNVSNVTNMSDMFNEARAFNSDLSTWNVSNVTSMSGMFYRATAFNSDLSTWDVSNVTSMSAMFNEARAFNSDLSTWNVSNVTSMIGMFYYASAFSNNDLSTWNVSNVTSHGGFDTGWGTGNTAPVFP